MRGSKRAARSARVAGEALGVAREMVEFAREVASESGAQTDRALEVARESGGVATRALAMVEELGDRLKAVPNGEVLAGEELQAFAEAFPQWTVSSGISNGRANKFYRRTIEASELPDERRGGELAHVTYLRLCDPEHFDIGLTKIFDSWSGDGDFVNSEFYTFSIYSDNAGPITYDDFARVADAERYLLDEGYIKPAVMEAEQAGAY